MNGFNNAEDMQAWQMSVLASLRTDRLTTRNFQERELSLRDHVLLSAASVLSTVNEMPESSTRADLGELLSIVNGVSDEASRYISLAADRGQIDHNETKAFEQMFCEAARLVTQMRELL